MKCNITQVAFGQLTTLIKDKTKTKHLSYTSFNFQPYMRQYNLMQASLIFKLRSFSVDCKENRKSSNLNLVCRLCNEELETQYHIINCPAIFKDVPLLDLSLILSDHVPAGDEEVLEICRRVNEFNKSISDSMSNASVEDE